MRYRSLKIHHDAESGFYTDAGIMSFGFCDTVDELKAEIDDCFAEDAEHFRDIDTPQDTSSLDAPWFAFA